MSRQTLYTEELADAICDQLSEGKSLVKICLDESMPNRRTVERWMAADEAFAARCARAREEGGEVYRDKVTDTADDCNEGNAQSSRVKISAYQWVAAKLAPKKYGDSSKVEMTGKDDGPIQYEDTTRERNIQSIEQLSARLAGAAPGTPAAPAASSTDAEPDTGSSA